MYNGSLSPVSSLHFLRKTPCASLETAPALPRETTGMSRSPMHRRQLQQRCTAESTARGSRARGGSGLVACVRDSALFVAQHVERLGQEKQGSHRIYEEQGRLGGDGGGRDPSSRLWFGGGSSPIALPQGQARDGPQRPCGELAGRCVRGRGRRACSETSGWRTRWLICAQSVLI